MRIAISIIALAALGGCKTAGDVRERHLVAQATSAKSVDQLAGCIALAAMGRGIEIGSETIDRGRSVSIAMRLGGMKTVLSVYDVVDLGSERQVSWYSVGGKGSAPTSIDGKVGQCL